MASGAVREFATNQHRIEKIAALRDFRKKRIVLRYRRINGLLAIHGEDGRLGIAVPLPQIDKLIL